MLDKLIALLKPSVSIEAKLTGITVFIGKTLERFNKRVETLEARQLQKGDKGDSVKGESGKDGKSGSDGKAGLPGKDGKDGKDGKAKNGKDGVSVVDSYIAADGNFMFKLSDGKEIDAGNPLQLETSLKNMVISTQLANKQITVSLTAPASPQVDDLWYDLT